MLTYIKCHYIQIKVFELIFKIIWEPFFLYAELKKALTKVFTRWIISCGTATASCQTAGQYCEDNKRINFIS